MLDDVEQALPSPWIERLGVLGIGVLANQLQIWAFDWVLYPFVIWYLGVFLGGAVMTVLSFVLCYTLIRFYDWTRRDWLGIETVKSLKDRKAGPRIAKLTSWLLKKSDPTAMLFLAIKFDPFITTVYMRHGSHQYNGLSRRDWKIFLGSLLIGNIYWILAMFTGVSILEWLWHQVSSVFL